MKETSSTPTTSPHNNPSDTQNTMRKDHFAYYMLLALALTGACAYQHAWIHTAVASLIAASALGVYLFARAKDSRRG